MHIPDGFLSTPVSVSTSLITLGFGALAHKKIKKYFDEEESRVPLVAAVSAFVFAAQMLNFPIISGTSGHFLGAGFTTALFGPWISFLVLSVVLFIQCVVFGDGGITALGANILIMGIVAPWTFYLSQKIIRIPVLKILNVTIGSWLSVVLASIVCSFLVGLSEVIDISKMLVVMVPIHALIGIGEGLITAGALRYIEESHVLKGLEYEKV